jgi:hypothetical protein
VGNPKTAVYYDYLLRAAEEASPSLGVEVVPGRVENNAGWKVYRGSTALGRPVACPSGPRFECVTKPWQATASPSMMQAGLAPQRRRCERF